MLLQPFIIDGPLWPDWWPWWVLASLAAHVLAPVAAGIVCDYRTDWLPAGFGTMTGIAATLAGTCLWFWWNIEPKELQVFDGEEVLAAYISLGILAAVQILPVIGVCWYVDRHRARRWGIRW